MGHVSLLAVPAEALSISGMLRFHDQKPTVGVPTAAAFVRRAAIRS